MARPTGVAEISAVLRFADRRGLRVAPQGTGHAAAALGDLAGAILLRTSALRDVRVDAARRIARVQAGADWATVTERAAAQGLFGLYGTDASVGVIGYTLGGGVSWYARQRGLASSSVSGVELVTADGEIRRADAEREPDLFWALRGGGGGFGVVTALDVRVFPVERVSAGALWFPIARAAELLAAFHEWATELDDRVTAAIRLMHVPDLPSAPEPLRGKGFVVMQGTLAMPDDEATSALAPLRGLGPAMDTVAGTTSDAVAAVHLAPPGPAPATNDGMILDDLPAGAIDALLRHIGPEARTAVAMIELRVLGGALGRPDPRGGALDRLPGAYLAMAGNVTPDAASVRDTRRDIAALRRDLAAWLNPVDYSNFREVPGAGLFFADDVRDRLARIRRRVDPRGVVLPMHATWTAPAGG